MYKLEDRVALVTGAGCGIGRAIALRLAQEGCAIGVLDVDADGADQTAQALQKLGVRSQVAIADVAEPSQVRMSVEAVLEAFGRIDILVNNAGILRVAPLLDMSCEDWQLTFRVNVEGVFNCCHAVGPHLVAQRSGRIINIASWLGKAGRAYNSAYCASKFAVIGLTQSLALELAPSQVTVNAICPGTVMETRMRDYADEQERKYGLPTAKERESTMPLGRLALPDDMARTAAFLASDEARYMTGQAINVTGGLWMN